MLAEGQMDAIRSCKPFLEVIPCEMSWGMEGRVAAWVVGKKKRGDPLDPANAPPHSPGPLPDSACVSKELVAIRASLPLQSMKRKSVFRAAHLFRHFVCV